MVGWFCQSVSFVIATFYLLMLTEIPFRSLLTVAQQGDILNGFDGSK